MKAKVLLLLFASFPLLLFGSAFACHFDSLNADADCDGWWADGYLYLAGVDSVDVNYEVTLYQDMMTAAYFSGSVLVLIGDPTFHLDVPWGMELCGDYTAEGTFSFTSSGGSDSRSFSVGFTCECDTVCHYTPGYWKTHPDAWPAGSLEIGGVPYSMEYLMMNVLWVPVQGDATMILAKHLIAAKLNMMNGAGDSIHDVIMEADAYLSTHPIGSKPSGSEKCYVIALKDMLEAYNEMGCPGDMDGYEVLPALKTSPMAPAGSATESKSWGAIKEIFK